MIKFAVRFQLQSDANLSKLARLIVYSIDSEDKTDAAIVADDTRINLTRAYATAENADDDVSLTLRYIAKDTGVKLARLLLQPYVFAILYYDEQILFDVPSLITAVDDISGTFTLTIGLHQG